MKKVKLIFVGAILLALLLVFETNFKPIFDIQRVDFDEAILMSICWIVWIMNNRSSVIGWIYALVVGILIIVLPIELYIRFLLWILAFITHWAIESFIKIRKQHKNKS